MIRYALAVCLGILLATAAIAILTGMFTLFAGNIQ